MAYDSPNVPSLASSEICPLGHIPVRFKRHLRQIAWFFSVSWLALASGSLSSRPSLIPGSWGTPAPSEPRPASCQLPRHSLGPGEAYRPADHTCSPWAQVSKGNILKKLFFHCLFGGWMRLPEASNFIHSSISHSQCWHRSRETTLSCWWEFRWIQISTGQIGPCAPKDLNVHKFWPGNSFSRSLSWENNQASVESHLVQDSSKRSKENLSNSDNKE